MEPTLKRCRSEDARLAETKQTRIQANPFLSFNARGKSRCIIEPPLGYPWFLFEANCTSGYYIGCPTSPVYQGFCNLLPADFDVQEVLNCCNGWLILVDSKNHLCLWNPLIQKYIQLSLPELKQGHSISGAVLSSPGNQTNNLDLNCMIMVFVGSSEYSLYDMSYSIIYCLLGEQRWNSVCYDYKSMDFSYPTPIILNGLVYIKGLDRKGRRGRRGDRFLFCINHVDPACIVLKEYCTLPPLSLKRDQLGYLVESRGELFYIIISWTEHDERRVLDLEAFKLDQVSLRWNKVREVGGRVFFIDETYSASSCAVRENKGGTLHYISTEGCFYSYSFLDNSLSTSLLHSTWNLPQSVDRLMCYLPDTRLIDKPDFQLNLVITGQYEVDARKMSKETINWELYEGFDDDDDADEETLLFCLSFDLIKFISGFLNPVDYLNFRSVSKICSLLPSQIEWGDALPTLSPWLVSSGNYSGIYNFVDSQLGGKYFMKTPKSLVDAKIIDSNNGWLLLMSNSFKTLTLCNPFTAQTVQLPEFSAPPYIRFSNIGFSRSPTYSSYLVVALSIAVGLSDIEIHIFLSAKERWNVYTFECDVAGRFNDESIYCPVFHDGDIYVLFNNGDLGVFRFQGDEPYSWELLEMTKGPHDFFNQNFLLEHDGKLLAVFVSEERKLINVFTLNKAAMSWEKVINMENHTLYLSRSSSFSTPARASWMKNIIFFPRLSKHDNVVFYSMYTNKFHTRANEARVVDYHDTRELILPGWIQPVWS